MYFNSAAAHSARLAALDQFQSASNILLSSTAALIDLYNSAGSRAIALARNKPSLPDASLLGAMVPELLMGHMRIASDVHEDMVRLIEAQIRNSSELAKFTLDKTALMSPPEIEIAIEAAESMIAVGETAAGKIGSASRKAVVRVANKIGRSTPSKKSTRG